MIYQFSSAIERRKNAKIEETAKIIVNIDMYTCGDGIDDDGVWLSFEGVDFCGFIRRPPSGMKSKNQIFEPRRDVDNTLSLTTIA
jgi:hypothetical protein